MFGEQNSNAILQTSLTLSLIVGKAHRAHGDRKSPPKSSSAIFLLVHAPHLSWPRVSPRIRSRN